MKKIVFCFMFALLANVLSVSAQDMIVTNDGESMKVYNVEVSQNAVFYQLENSSEAEIKRMPKTEILIIRKQDGTKIDPNETNEKTLDIPRERPYGLRDAAPKHEVNTATISKDIHVQKKSGIKTFFAKTSDGKELQYEILSDEDKTLKVIMGFEDGEFSYTGGYKETNYIIPEYVMVHDEKYTVTEIGKGAFYDCKVEEVVFPLTLKIIRYAAFRQTRLKSIILPQGLEIIEAEAFHSAGRKDGISEIYIPKSVKQIGEYCFKDCGAQRSFRGYYQGYISCLPDIVTPGNCTTFGLDEQAVEPYLEKIKMK